MKEKGFEEVLEALPISAGGVGAGRHRDSGRIGAGGGDRRGAAGKGQMATGRLVETLLRQPLIHTNRQRRN